MPSSTALPSRIAWRYLRGHGGGGNAVPILSRIAMAALAVGSAALIVLFSVFNGFEEVIGNLYKSFYADIRISAVRGKTFPADAVPIEKVLAQPGVAAAAPSLEDNAFVTREEDQVIVTVKGVTNDFFHIANLSPFIEAGRDSLVPGELPTAIIGSGVQAQIGLDPDNDFSRFSLFYPDPDGLASAASSPMEAIRSADLKPDGVFRVQEEFDSRYVLTRLEVVQNLLHAEGRISAIEIKAAPEADLEKIKRDLQQMAGPAFRVETRFEQNRTLYGVMRSEKWATYVILLFVLLIASVNMIGALLLLVLEKRRDLAILRAMGATSRTLRLIVYFEGLLWAAVGGGLGLLLGSALCAGQARWGWLKLGESFIIQAYPISLRLQDVLVVSATVLGVGLLAALYPAVRAGRIEASGLRNS